MREFFDRDFFGFVVGQAQVVLGANEVFFHFHECGNGLIDFLDSSTVFFRGQMVVFGKVFTSDKFLCIKPDEPVPRDVVLFMSLPGKILNRLNSIAKMEKRIEALEKELRELKENYKTREQLIVQLFQRLALCESMAGIETKIEQPSNSIVD